MWSWLLRIGFGALLRGLIAAGLRVLEREDMKRHGRVEVENALLRRRLDDNRLVEKARLDSDLRVERDGVRAHDPDERPG
jgi:hypothetical protein